MWQKMKLFIIHTNVSSLFNITFACWNNINNKVVFSRCSDDSWCYNGTTSTTLKYTTLVYLKPFPSYEISAADDFKHILSKNQNNLYNWMDNLWLKEENIVVKGEIARFEQFLLLSLYFQKAVCCRGVRKRLYDGKC